MNGKEWLRDTFTLLTLQGSSRLHTKPPDSYVEHMEGKLAVILIPGLYERSGLLSRVGKVVSERGHDVWTVPELGENLSDVDTSIKKIIRVIHLNHLLHPIAIGHSYGGIVAYEMLRLGFTYGSIAIAAPFSGSDVAKRFPLSRSIREMTPQSQTIQEIRKNSGEIPKNMVSIFPESDNFIPNGSYLEGAENIEIYESGHHNILKHADVRGAIIRKLELWEEERYSI